MIRTASMLISTLNRNEADVYIVKWVDTINIFTRIELHNYRTLIDVSGELSLAGRWDSGTITYVLFWCARRYTQIYTEF